MGIKIFPWDLIPRGIDSHGNQIPWDFVVILLGIKSYESQTLGNIFISLRIKSFNNIDSYLET